MTCSVIEFVNLFFLILSFHVCNNFTILIYILHFSIAEPLSILICIKKIKIEYIQYMSSKNQSKLCFIISTKT